MTPRYFRLIPSLLIYISLAAVVRAERLPIRIYTSADGLGSSFVNNMMRDSRGFLWICTRDGLSRFDGSRFITYQVGDATAPPGIEQIIESRSGIYWIVTTGGLYRFDPAVPSTTASTNPDRPTLNARFVSTWRNYLFEDRDGTLWSGGDGLYILSEKDQQLVTQKVELNFPADPKIPFVIYNMIQGEDKSLWMNTPLGLIRRWPQGQVTLYATKMARQNGITHVMGDSGGRIWLAHLEGVCVIKPESNPPTSSGGAVVNLDEVAEKRSFERTPIGWPDRPGQVVNYSAGSKEKTYRWLYQTSDKHIWFSERNRLFEFDGQTFQSHIQNSIEDSSMMMEDVNGNLWIGSSKALGRFDRHGFTSYGTSDGLKNTYVLAINQGQDGEVYLVAGAWSVSVFDGKGFTTIRPPISADATTMWSVNTSFQDSAGEWWFLTNGTLYRFAATKDNRNLPHQQPVATYHQSDGFENELFYRIFEDLHHNILIATSGGGLSQWSRDTKTFQPFSVPGNPLSNRSISSFAEDHHGNLWFGFSDGGLVRYASGQVTDFKPADGAPNGLITSMYVDGRGTLWIGSSQQGVTQVVDPNSTHPTFALLTTNNGLSSNNVRAITGDLSGNIYLGTARGVDRISIENLQIKHYSVNDGLAGDFVTSAFCDRAGNLWFGTPNGVSRLVPSKDVSAAAPAVWISGLQIAGTHRPLSELGSVDIPRIEMGYSENDLQIDFFGIDFGSEALRYQYKLEGADNDWSAPTLQRAVTYANMSPGTYRFLVRAISRDGSSSAKPATFSFRIFPPVWQRWWFLTLAALVMIAIAYSLYRYRVAQLLKVERVRTRIATDLHDDIGASLSRMAILSEVVKQQTAGDNGNQSAGLLTEIADSARGLVDSMSDIVWSIDPRRDDLQSLVRRLRQFASDVLEAREIDWELRVPPEVESLKLGPDERQHLFLILKESINNIVRHGAGTKTVSISINIAGRQLIAEIKDDGCGFTPEHPDEARAKGRGGNGLPNMRERAAQMGGRLDIASSPGAGTLLKLQVPIK